MVEDLKEARTKTVCGEGKLHHPPWGDLIPQDEWTECCSAIAAFRSANIDFLIGGALGLGVYTGRLRNTKDVDFFVVPDDVAPAIKALGDSGFGDYYPKLPYDRGWIYRSTRNGFIVDIIFRMANRRADVDSLWFDRAHEAEINGEFLRVVPPEELLWQKLYVMQRDRCDWPDILNLISATGACLDWDHLSERLGTDLPLLQAVLTLFEWLSPGEADHISLPVWHHRGFPVASADKEQTMRRHVALLDSRAWYRKTIPPGLPLKV